MAEAQRAVLITGAARRVGRAIALHFAGKGYDVALHYHRSHPDAEATRGAILQKGVNCHLFSLDLTKINTLPGLVDKVFKVLPHCNVLINNASQLERGCFMETDEALFDRQMAINFKAPFFLTQAFVKRCPEARIVNILDTNITRHHSSHCAYLLSKKALAECTRIAAYELAPQARVNGICPASVIPAEGESPEFTASYTSRTPLKRGTDPEDLAEAVLYLVEARNLTGELLFLDGGKHLT